MRRMRLASAEFPVALLFNEAFLVGFAHLQRQKFGANGFFEVLCGLAESKSALVMIRWYRINFGFEGVPEMF